MKIVATIGIIILIHRSFIYFRRDSADDSYRLKITDVKVLYVSNNYMNGDTYHETLIKETKNYNRLEVDCEILQDLPIDTKVDVRLFQSTDKNGPWTYLANYASYICDKNDSYYKYRRYWSNLITMQTEGGKCVQKGKYLMKNAGVFKFWDLLPKNETKGVYFMSRNALRTSETIITISEYRYESIES